VLKLLDEKLGAYAARKRGARRGSPGGGATTAAAAAAGEGEASERARRARYFTASAMAEADGDGEGEGEVGDAVTLRPLGAAMVGAAGTHEGRR